MKSYLKSDENGRVIVPERKISEQKTCFQCGKELTKDSTFIYEDYGYNKSVIKGAGCNACVQTSKKQLEGVV